MIDEERARALVRASRHRQLCGNWTDESEQQLIEQIAEALCAVRAPLEAEIVWLKSIQPSREHDAAVRQAARAEMREEAARRAESYMLTNAHHGEAIAAAIRRLK